MLKTYTDTAPDLSEELKWAQFDHGFGGFSRFQCGNFHAGESGADARNGAQCAQCETVFQKFSAIHNDSFPGSVNLLSINNIIGKRFFYKSFPEKKTLFAREQLA